MKTFLQNRIWVYFRERFAFSQFLPLCVLLGGISSLLLSSLSIETGLTILALFLFLLRLRIFDEFKDAEHDQKYYPDRPVPRGLVSLSELRKLGVFIGLLEILIAMTAGSHALYLFVLLSAYSWLMYYEFFLGKWIKERFSLYIFLHEVSLIPLFLYLFSLNGLQIQDIWRTETAIWIGVLGGFLFLLEISRKIRSSKEETDSNDTYSGQYGLRGSLSLLLVIWFVIVRSLYMVVKIADWDPFIILLNYASISIASLALLAVLIKFFRSYNSETPFSGKNVFKASILFFAIVASSLLLSLLFHGI